MKISAAILSALLLAVAIVSATAAKNGGGCCMIYTKVSQLRKLPLNLIKEHRMQEVTGSCNIPAVVFITKRNRRICANPKAKHVKQILKKLRGKKNKTQDPSQRKVKQ
ncbi:hypothetical protein SKAU_G00198300 [Synaphobranchus kaupii]|uniref:Chemokine interleukin-8-like domain-containing protein n=1 Tax=Synaphobranchus kaupii TaxID=118154 RepID=A0A9Q1FF18_SYNKA|nr:hypothetical protein SKAU_G00198300 [Synaphobranchus kaupii]